MLCNRLHSITTFFFSVFLSSGALAASVDDYNGKFGYFLKCGDPVSPCIWDDFSVTAWIGSEKNSSYVVATRGFAGPNQIPPEDFAAYGVIVFKSKATAHDYSRHKLICDAYTAAFEHFSLSDQPRENQMVTIWPILKDRTADEINGMARASTCEAAIENFGMPYSEKILKTLMAYRSDREDYDLSGTGPFLVAFAPTRPIGEKGSFALFLDLSNVSSYDYALHWMLVWKERIQENPELWREGFEPKSLLDVVRRFFDDNAYVINSVL